MNCLSAKGKEGAVIEVLVAVLLAVLVIACLVGVAALCAILYDDVFSQLKRKGGKNE